MQIANQLSLLLALNSWCYCSGEQGLTAQHLTHYVVWIASLIRGCSYFRPHCGVFVKHMLTALYFYIHYQLCIGDSLIQ